MAGKAKSYDSVAINYRWLPAAAAAGQSGDVQPVSYVAPASTKAPIQILSIEYPHPAGRKGIALVEVIVGRDPATMPAKKPEGWLEGVRRATRDRMPGLTFGEGIESAWALNVPIAEVDQLIERLDAAGYFADGRRPVAGAELSARINGLSFSKPWNSVPELNALIVRVRHEGKLVSHREPLESTSPPQSASPAVTASFARQLSVVHWIRQCQSRHAAGRCTSAARVTTALYSAPAEEYPPGQFERLPPVE